ncbi:pro-corazonin-like isoform X2 [Chelonus insularis]|nr:pro-corazonin-like isoform X2 [Chelonus insularis]
MSYLSCVLIVLSSMMITATCQMFQYSRGWTNGKRDNSKLGAGLPMEIKGNHLVTDGNQFIDPAISYCAFHKLRMLLQKDDGDEQIYFLPCERLGFIAKAFKDGKVPNHYRHITVNEDNNDNNVDNYVTS